MAVLSKNRRGPSSGHDFDRIKEPMFGSGRGKMNKRKDLYGSDYIYVYKEDEDDDLINDSEIGINKNYHRAHDMDWCNGEKNEHHALNRFFDAMEEDELGGSFDVDNDDLSEIDFLFGEGEDDNG